MDFYEIVVDTKTGPNRHTDAVLYPDFKHRKSRDLICKGGTMFAWWNDDHWDDSPDNLVQAIDASLREAKALYLKDHPGDHVKVRYMESHSSKVKIDFDKYCEARVQSDVPFNTKILFSDAKPKREDYSTSHLNYVPKEGSTEAFDTLLGRLYSEEELQKILWFMGALLSNKMQTIQKFMFLYGGKGTGKGTVIDIFKLMFDGYWSPTSLRELTGGGAFATSVIEEVPLLIDEDCDLSGIKDDTNLLKLVAHESILVNKKYKTPYSVSFPGLLITASNQRYRVRNVDSGITRRAIVVEPSTFTFDSKTYFELKNRIKYEIPAIAYKAMAIFKELGPFYYEEYVDRDMIEATDYIYGFVSEYQEQLGDMVTLDRASALFKTYLEDLGFETRGYKRKIKSELQRYYRSFHTQKKVDGVKLSNVFEGFKEELIHNTTKQKAAVDSWIKLGTDAISKLDMTLQSNPAQYAKADGKPEKRWESVTSVLSDLDTSKLHYVMVPKSHIVIDFDIKDDDGNKSLYLNMLAASNFPPTYAEVSKSGCGLHLHYIYDGDTAKLSSLYDKDIEIKVFTGRASLRRQLTKFVNLPIAHISVGLPLKEENLKVYKDVKDIVWNEKRMYNAITRALRREVWPNTTPSMQLIAKIFEDARKQGTKYDLEELRNDIYAFAMGSTNQKDYCRGLYRKIKFKTIEDDDLVPAQRAGKMVVPIEELYFLDIEVVPNYWGVVIKQFNSKTIKKYTNPTPAEVEYILSLPFIGFNCRNYDNHILQAGLLGFNNAEMYNLSKSLITGDSHGFAGARELSYADEYDYIVDKHSLKWWEIEMARVARLKGQPSPVKHDEFEYDFDQPLTEEQWKRCLDYCANDVIGTEELFKHRFDDYQARLMMAELSGLSVNSPGRAHAAAILFGNDPRPQDKLVYTDLSKDFPGYIYDAKTNKSSYMGECPSEGGYVYYEPGIYHNVVVFDIASMHPHSAIAMNYFGPYAQRFKDLVETRICIKHGDFEKARTLFDGKLAPYLENESSAKQLAAALKIFINSIYGYTKAKFDNQFKQKDNIDNIIAKRGALFMINLKNEVQKRGYKVIHIKTDSIKVSNPDEEITKFIYEYGKQWGYTFEVEDEYAIFAIINKSTYIAKTPDGKWEAKAAEFAQPYVFKTLFTGEQIDVNDYFITKEVKGKMYIGDRFVGRIGRVYASLSGDDVWRVDGDKRSHVTGTVGYKWKLEQDYPGVMDIDRRYYDGLCEEAIKHLNEVGPSGEIVRVTTQFKDLVTYY